MKILLTGICGFVGSYIAEQILAQTDWDIVGVDRYSYAGRQDNIAHLDQSRIQLIYHDITKPFDHIVKIDYIIHNGAETHVRNSLINPEPFVQANIIGTFNMLEFARIANPKKFLYISTDEVFGASTIPHKEIDALNPSNPYSATKAAGEYLVRAYGRTYGVPYLITRTSNIYGKRQHLEKYLPMVIDKIKRGRMVQIHTDSEGNSGSRQWIHASDQARALIFLLQSNAVNDTFHIAGEQKSNEDIAKDLVEPLGRALYAEKADATKLYKGHDLHYCLDDSKIRALGWSPKITLEEGLKLTV